jgi:uncharacterized membrane protein
MKYPNILLGEYEMLIPNLLNYQSLNKKSLLKLAFILNILFIVFTLININFVGYSVFRYIFTFIYITFIPGFYLIRVFKLNNLKNIEVILFSVGLSITSLMFIGLGLNYLGIFFSFQSITLNKLLISFIAIVSFLSLIIYFRENSFSEKVDNLNVSIKNVLIFFLFLSLSFSGVYYMYYYDFNIILIFLYLLISILPLLFIFRSNNMKYFGAILIVSMTVSLLFNRTLLSNYISGWDIQQEYYLSSLVIKNSFWNSMLSYDYNGMLSIVMLAPIYSIILKLDLVWVFKIIYPLLFSLVPCCLFLVFKEQFDGKIAFLSCFFIISLYTFYLEMPQLGRQEIAEIFFVLVIYLITNKSLGKGKRSLLAVIFLTSLSVSHYGLSYFTIYFLVVVLIAGKFFDNNFIKKFVYRMDTSVITKSSDKIISVFVVIFFAVVTVTWNLYIASSITIIHIASLSTRFVTALLTDFFSPSSSQGLSIILLQQDSFSHLITKYLSFFMIFLISLGILYLLINYHKLEINNEYKALSLASFSLCVVGVVLPYVSSALNTTRLFHITTLVLAPFVVLGGQMIFLFLKSIFRMKNDVRDFNLKFIAIVLCIFMLFNSGWIYEVTGDHPTSYLLNNNIDTSIFNDGEITGAKYWNSLRSDQSIYADQNRWLLLESINLTSTIPAYYRFNSTDHLSIPRNTFIYLGTYNINTNRFLLLNSPDVDFYSISTVVFNSSKVYSNLYCDIYLK